MLGLYDASVRQPFQVCASSSRTKRIFVGIVCLGLILEVEEQSSLAINPCANPSWYPKVSVAVSVVNHDRMMIAS